MKALIALAVLLLCLVGCTQPADITIIYTGEHPKLTIDMSGATVFFTEKEVDNVTVHKIEYRKRVGLW